MLIGALSNDLNRVANLSYRGSWRAAEKFWEQVQSWVTELKLQKNKPYIEKITECLAKEKLKVEDKNQAEKNLMYSIIFQNYALYLED